MVIDKDNWTNEQLQTVAQSCIQKKFDLAVSNPCFEIWILLHFEEIQKSNTNVTSTKKLKNYLSIKHSSTPKSIAIKNYMKQGELAINNAKALDKNSNERWPSKTGTRVYLIVEKIISK